jgi:hypothetical protein
LAIEFFSGFYNWFKEGMQSLKKMPYEIAAPRCKRGAAWNINEMKKAYP